MKKLLQMFFILSFVLSAGEHPTSTGTDPLEYYSPLSYKFSNVLDDSSTNSSEAEDRYYEYFEVLADRKDVKAREIFTDEQIQYLALEAEEEIFLDKTKLGIMVSSNKRTLFVVPAGVQYAGSSDRSIR